MRMLIGSSFFAAKSDPDPGKTLKLYQILTNDKQALVSNTGKMKSLYSNFILLLLLNMLFMPIYLSHGVVFSLYLSSI
jgi:hypothetical protein